MTFCDIEASSVMQSVSTGTIKFCATGKSGLGHLRRVSNIARALRRERPDVSLVLVTNAPISGLSHEDCECFCEVHQVPRERMAGLLTSLPRGPVVIDTAVIPGVETLLDPLALVLRETVASKLGEFRLEGGRPWDLVLVPSPPAHWQPERSRIGWRHLVYAGWISRKTEYRGGVLPRGMTGRPTLLVATGGGGTRDTAIRLRCEIDAVLSEVKRSCLGVQILQAVGPRLPEEGRLLEAHDRVDVGSRLNEAFAEADAVVSTVGYNSVLELAALTTPALLVPISRTFDDQGERARVWGPLLGHAHKEGNACASGEWLAGILRGRLRRSAVDLGDGSAERAAGAILQLVPKTVFEKPIKSIARARAIVAVAQSIAKADGPVPALELDEKRELLVMPHIEGQDLRKIASTRQRCAGTGTLEAISDLFIVAMGELARFHRAGVKAEARGLKEFDAFAKVRPRIPFLYNDDQRARVERLSDRLTVRLREMAACSTTIVHGDFHLGQVMVESATARAHIIDLDDVAMGSPEADIGNFGAHVVTASGLYSGNVTQGMATLLPVLIDAYQSEAGALRLEKQAVALYAAAALLRRLLKLYVAGRDVARHGDILAAAEVLSDMATALQLGSPHTTLTSDLTKRRLTGTYSQ